MPKRKKISLASEDSKDGSECSKQRKFLDPIEMCHELYETIRNHKADDGRLICESFIRTPNRRSLPDYYDIVSSPIDLMKIQQKLKTDEYIDVNQFSSDIELLVNNTKSYYKKSSQEYKDASELWEIFVETKNELLAEHRTKEEDKSSEIDDDRGSEYSEDDSAYEELFTTVMTAADMEGRPLSTMFQLLPSRTTCDLAMTSDEHSLDQGQENETYHFKILVPSVAAGAIIGKGGETISQLQNQAGAKVKMSKATEFYPGTKERVCLITGSVEGILRILHFIMEKVKEKPDVNAKMAIDFDHNQPVEREKQVKILVPNNTAGMIIGKGGSYIKQIKKESGSYVQISQKYKDHALAERCITVIGEMENNKIACYMILTKIIEDPQSGSCLNVSYADVTGPVANSNPTGSPFAHPHCVPGDAANNSSTNYCSNDSLGSLSPTNNFQSPQTGPTHPGNLPFIGIGMGGFATSPTNVIEVIENIETVLRGSGYSEQAVSEISAAMNTLANYGMLGLSMFNGANDDPVGSGLRMEMQNSAAVSCSIPPPVGIANQSMYDVSVPGMEAACNYMVASGPMEARSNMLNLTCSLGNRMSELSLEQRFIPPPISSSKDQFPIQAEAAIFEPFGRTSPTLASPSAAALPLNNNSFGLGTGFSSEPPVLIKSPISSDQITSDTAKVEIKVKEIIARAILGPGGKDLENIQRFSKANIQIFKKRIFAPGTCDHVITITGLPKAVNTAQYLIKRQIAEEEAKRA